MKLYRLEFLNKKKEKSFTKKNSHNFKAKLDSNKKLMSLLCIISILASTLGGCSFGKNDSKSTKIPYMMKVNNQKLNVIEDKYRTCYEVFVGSFYDSDGDKKGDLKGVTKKIDYIKSLGANEIWLMPIMPSTTYHKYDVKDYMDIDKDYGKMADFEELVKKCHEKKIHVIIDFVMNHTSSEHPWFKEAVKYLKTLQAGEEPDPKVCKYVNYYNFTKDKTKSGYHKIAGTEYSYESVFWEKMPDLNLYNEDVRNEISQITKFWIDKGVDGFRLDAAKEYISGNTTENVKILKWFNDMVRSQKQDIYTVGEVWEKYPIYTEYYKSGIDSFFDFSFADKDGYISRVLSQTTDNGASTYGMAIQEVDSLMKKNNPNGISAPFYTNHDLCRSAGYYGGKNAKNQTKMAQGMNLMMSGNAFIYYGEEIGMKGSGKDENKRLSMYWKDGTKYKGRCNDPVDAEKTKMIYPSVSEQETDNYSILNYVKQAVKLRNIYPEIARGDTEFLEEYSNKKVCVLKKKYNGKEILLIFNTTDKAVKVDLKGLEINGKPVKEAKIGGLLQVDENNPSKKGNTVELPKYCIEILK